MSFLYPWRDTLELPQVAHDRRSRRIERFLVFRPGFVGMTLQPLEDKVGMSV